MEANRCLALQESGTETRFPVDAWTTAGSDTSECGRVGVGVAIGIGNESCRLSGAFIGKDTDGTGLTLFTVSIRIEVPAVAEKLFKLWLLKGKFFVAKPISEDCVCKTVDFEGKD